MTRQGKSLTPLGETEMEVLGHVWDLGEATVNDVRDRILDDRDVAYTTIMTVMKNLAEKGYLTYRKEGRSYVYEPERSRDEVRSDLLMNLLDKAFGGSASQLVQTLVKSEDLDEKHWDEIRQLIESLESDSGEVHD